MLRDLTERIFKFWSCWVLCTAGQEATWEYKTVVQLCGIHLEQLTSLHSFVGDLVLHFHCSGSYLSTRHLILSYLCVSVTLFATSQYGMHCLPLYIFIQSVRLQMVLEHNRRSTWTRSLRVLRHAPLGGHCGETMLLEGRDTHHQHSAALLATSKKNSSQTAVQVWGKLESGSNIYFYLAWRIYAIAWIHETMEWVSDTESLER